MENLRAVKYDLPDIRVLESAKEIDFMVWQPDRIYLVLGRSNEAAGSLIAENVDADQVRVLKRPSGGEAVLLSPRMLVIALKLPINSLEKIHDAFVVANDLIKSALQKQGVRNIRSRGISDICIGEMKILGSAIYKKPDSVFYHAVLNVSEDVRLIDRYLKHPQREPDYRKGRDHTTFVSSLWAQSFLPDISVLKEAILSEFERKFG
jgi:lipoate-protein ligase A